MEAPSRQKTLPFWLSSKIAACTVDTATQTAEATFLSKWHFRDAGFADKVSRGERLIIDESGAAVKEAEAHALLANGDMLYGCTVKMGTRRGEHPNGEHPSEVFPVNLDQIFANQLGKPEVLRNMCWIAWTKDSGTISIQLAFTVTVCCSLHLTSFPYDKHVIPFELETRTWRRNGLTPPVSWVLCAREPEWARNLVTARYSEDDCIVCMKVFESPEFYFDEPCAHLSHGGKKPLLCIQIERKSRFFVQRVTVPVFIVVLAAISCFMIRGRSYELEFNATFVSMLTITVYALTIQDKLPMLPYMTLGDYYFAFGYFYHLILCAKTVATSHRVPLSFCRGDDPDWVEKLPGEMATDWNECEVADTLTLLLAAVWIGLHTILFIDSYLPRAYRPSSRVSPSYTKLARRFDAKARWKREKPQHVPLAQPQPEPEPEPEAPPSVPSDHQATPDNQATPELCSILINAVPCLKTAPGL